MKKILFLPGILSRHTENPLYYDLAKRAITMLYQRRSAIGLVGEAINVETGEWISTGSLLPWCPGTLGRSGKGSPASCLLVQCVEHPWFGAGTEAHPMKRI